jgi:uncharacterized membrane protein YbhN (UPF0104 family)
MKRRRRNPSIGAVLRVALSRSRLFYTPIAVSFVAVLLLTEREVLVERFSTLAPSTVLLIIGLIFAGHLFIGLSSLASFRIYGTSLSYAIVLRTHVSRLPARYIPGGVWQTVSRSLDFVELGVPSRRVFTVMAAEITFSVATAAILGGACLFLSTSDFATLGLALFSCGCIAVPIFFFVSARLLRERPLRPALPLLAATVCYVLVWAFYATAFSLFLTQFTSHINWPTTAGVFLASWLAGFFAFFAPQGIGVFEVTAGIMLAKPTSAVVIGTLFGFRFVGLIADISIYTLYVLARLLLHLHRRPSDIDPTKQRA